MKLNVLMGALKTIVVKYINRKLPEDTKDIHELVGKISYLFKSSQYQYEHELRLIVNGSGFVKKIDLAFSPPKVYVKLINISSLIEKITLGPRIPFANEWAAGFFYKLEEKKLHADILISHLPFK